MSGYSIFQVTLQESLSRLSIFESQPAEKNSYYALAVALAHAPTSTLPVIDLAARLCTHIDKQVPVICNIYVTHLVNNKFWVCIQIHDQKFKQVAQEQL
jgi:hypothetical protein